MKRYEFTRPKTKNTESDYFYFLRNMARDNNYYAPKYRVRYGMTFSSLIGAGLVKCENREFKITDMGKFYVRYVNSTTNPSKIILRTIMGV